MQMEDSIPGAPANNPLPPCPDTPNCVLATRQFEMTPDALFERVKQALQHMEASQIEVDPETRRVDAVFPVFLFKDDVAVVIALHPSGSALHIRSASRVGAYDFGVNRRRVQRFFETLETL
ncbi:MAG TPA: DUF1499 domain-containing protein [Rhodothermales bacterium]|nr:DUF1499 domain-containing protein [Rhodothermales bacterium]